MQNKLYKNQLADYFYKENHPKPADDAGMGKTAAESGMGKLGENSLG